jgi:chemotaxis methyl-accepting protein methylase
MSVLFRDPDFFKSLLTNVFHIYHYNGVQWMFFGEETYSLAILLKEMDLLLSQGYMRRILVQSFDKSKKESTTNDFKEYSTNYFSCGEKSL